VPDEQRQDRIARNETSYRDVNEAIEAGRAGKADDVPRPYMCECGLLECNELVELTLAEYEAVRAVGKRFFMVAGHEIPDVEHVVDRHERFIVAEKDELGAKVAEQRDPRSR
jgi:hypothetical protein